MPANGVIVKIVVRDLELLFQGQLNFNISENLRASPKMNRTTYIFLDIVSTKYTIVKFTTNDFDLLFQGKNADFVY